jgi:hypothetical protein
MGLPFWRGKLPKEGASFLFCCAMEAELQTLLCGLNRTTSSVGNIPGGKTGAEKAPGRGRTR